MGDRNPERVIAETLAALPCQQLDEEKEICAICHQAMARTQDKTIHMMRHSNFVWHLYLQYYILLYK